MPITEQQIQAAKKIQGAAAHDNNQTIRLVAGPGTGKSFVIEERVYWLLSKKNILAENIIAVSFTRAAAKDLKERINGFCIKNNQHNVTDVKVSTLHSLALSLLRKTGNLSLYPTDPRIMDDWELSLIFDAEFGDKVDTTPTRCGEIRRDHEAFWSTGSWNPPNLPVLKKPITQTERTSFSSFYGPRTQTYSCVLPGETIRMCVNLMQSGLINPVKVLSVQHLIVDEVQDLNPCDFEFIDLLIKKGVNVFVSGDDDQSVYSFRYAFPQGIQDFTTKYPDSTDHVLSDCFRCTPLILNAAKNVIINFPAQNRIPKNLNSVYTSSSPINDGFLQANTFRNPRIESAYIANSCRALIDSGVPPEDLMILISNKREQLKYITDAFNSLGIGYDANQRDEFKDSDHGRFLLSLLRIIEDANDYVAHRVILGTPKYIGVSTCSNITDKVISNNINYKTIFYNESPTGVFSNRETKAIEKSKKNILTIQNWNLNESLNQKADEIDQILLNNFSQLEVDEWRNFIRDMPNNMTLSELKDYLQTDSQEIKDKILNTILEKSAQENLQPTTAPKKVRIMSLHTSKGLSAKVVFIPGLEEGLFPNTIAQTIPGLILECARLFYVAITRAKAACVISHSESRNLYGSNTPMVPSRFCTHTGAVFQEQNDPSLTDEEIQLINTCINNL